MGAKLQDLVKPDSERPEKKIYVEFEKQSRAKKLQQQSDEHFFVTPGKGRPGKRRPRRPAALQPTRARS